MTKPKLNLRPPATTPPDQAKIEALEALIQSLNQTMDELGAPIAMLRRELIDATTYRRQTTVEQLQAGWRAAATIRAKIEPLEAEYDNAYGKQLTAKRHLQVAKRSCHRAGLEITGK